MHQNILVYFRNDLRLHDHEPLQTAAENGTRMIGMYNFNPEHFKKNKFGFRRIGAFRARFMMESVEELRTKLRKIGGDLIITIGNPVDTIPALCRKLQIHQVVAHDEPAYEEQQEQKALADKLLKEKIELKLFWGNTLLHPDELPFTKNNIPELFTDFRKAVERKAVYRTSLSEIRKLSVIPHNLPELTCNLQALGFDKEEHVDRDYLFAGGETAALKRLQYYFWETKLVATYKETRNGLLGSDFSSHFSPWLASGCLSPARVMDELKVFESTQVKNDSTYWLLFELLWRDFFRFSMRKFGAAYFKKEGIKNQSISWVEDIELFEKWRLGKTGFPFIDANMRELLHTGFMSNRGRQNVASFLCKNLGINWLWGAAWFESVLIDYDACSNYGNWAYIAGVGNDARIFRYFNIDKQADTYDKSGMYRKYWLDKDGYLSAAHKPIVDLEESMKIAENRFKESIK